MAQAKPIQTKDNRTRVLLVDDHAVVRYGIAQLINRESDMMVCGEEEVALSDDPGSCVSPEGGVACRTAWATQRKGAASPSN